MAANASSDADLPLPFRRLDYRAAFVLLITYVAAARGGHLRALPGLLDGVVVAEAVDGTLRARPDHAPDQLDARELQQRLAQGTDFPIYFWNSFKVASLSTVFTVVVSSTPPMRSRASAFPGATPTGCCCSLTQMFPHILLVIPLFLIIRDLGLFNTHAALIIAYTAFSLPFSIWLLRGFFEAIPEELEDAAAIDGASMLRTLHVIILPLAGPGHRGRRHVRLHPRMERVPVRAGLSAIARALHDAARPRQLPGGISPSAGT